MRRDRLEVVPWIWEHGANFVEEICVFEGVKKFARRCMLEIAVYRAVVADPRCPRAARWLLGAAVAYAVSPIDLIPDFIPVLGHLDDVLIVPLLVWLALRMVPAHVVAEHRARLLS